VGSSQIRFSDGASYEQMMGGWSRTAGDAFLDWLRPANGLAWLDVGCGSGAFSSLVLERCAPKSLLGIDPSEAQLTFARGRGLSSTATFRLGDAMGIDLPDRSVDVAVAALVMHFMPDPLQGVMEMSRVVRPGGLVAAYSWHLEGGGFPYEAVHRALRECGLEAPEPPHPEAGNQDELVRLWRAAGLSGIASREITVSRSFSDFDDYWETARMSPRILAVLNRLSPDRLEQVRNATHGNIPDATVLSARANAVMGRTVPAVSSNA
jgi:SAM-dependent methyltransferase